MILFTVYLIITGCIASYINFLEYRLDKGYLNIMDLISLIIFFFTGFFIVPLYLIIQLLIKLSNVKFFEVKKEDYDPNAICYVTPALRRSECGTTCCTPNEVK